MSNQFLGITEKLSFLIQQTPLALIEWNQDLCVISWNPAAEKIFGYSAEEIYLQPVSRIVSPTVQTTLKPLMVALLEERKTVVYQNENLRKDGSIIICEWINTPVFDDEGRMLSIYSIAQNVTDRVMAERRLQESEAQLLEKSTTLEQVVEQLQQAQIQLVQSEKMSALGNLVAGVAHEINNPLGFLKGNIRPALEHLEDLFALLDAYAEHHPDPHQQVQQLIEEVDLEFIRQDLPKLLESMNQGIDRIKTISDSLRTFSRLDSEYPVSFDLQDGLDSTILLLKHRLKSHDHRPAIQVIKNYGDVPEVECFAGQLNQVFMNLLANAIDELDEACRDHPVQALSENPPQIIITTALSADQKSVHLSIQDNGRGIAEELQSQIFEHLFTTKLVGKGTGLGLTLSRQVIEEKHGGRLWLESQLGAGTTFMIELPLVCVDRS